MTMSAAQIVLARAQVLAVRHLYPSPGSHFMRRFPFAQARRASSEKVPTISSSFQSYPMETPPPPSPSASTSTGSDAPEPQTSLNGIPTAHETRPPLRKQENRRAVRTASTPTETSPSPQSQPPLTTSPSTLSTSTVSAPSPSSNPQSQTQSPPRKRTFRPRKAAITLTPAAVEQVRKRLTGPEPRFLKIGVRNRGCSGLAYNLEYVDAPETFDEIVEQDGVKVLIDTKALFSVIGSKMDWVENMLNEQFVFDNPNIKGSCGCGESFMV